MPDSADLQRRVDRLDWWQTIDLGGGVVTPGRGGSAPRLERMRLPRDLTGRTVLDVGTFDGHYAFEAERRGADRVVAADIHERETFTLAHEALGSRVEFVRIDVREMTADEVGTFDVVIFAGVLYHLPDPMNALVRVAEVTSDLMILETDSALNHLAVPAAEFRGERAGLRSDSPNWWIFNEACVHRMIHVAGFARWETVWGPGPAENQDGPLKRILRRVWPRRFPHPEHARLMVHAWKEPG